MSKSKNILEIRNVTKKFNTPNNKVLTACDNISLEFEEGKILAIVGESGCGKSTLMKMIVQLEEVTSGEILYGGEDITKLKGEKLRQNRRHIQMVFHVLLATLLLIHQFLSNNVLQLFFLHYYDHYFL